MAKEKITHQTPSYELVYAKNLFSFDPKDYKKDEIGAIDHGLKKLKDILEHV